MRALIILWLAAFLAGWTVPNPTLTPGVADPQCNVVKVCVKGYAGTVRDVGEAEKKAVCKAYGITKGCPGPAYELDHLISLELCGANDAKNLWPQPIAEAKQKDRWEDALHERVCSGGLTLEAAQQLVTNPNNWGDAPPAKRKKKVNP